MISHLSLGQVERDGYLVSTQTRKVVMVVELVLQFPYLVFGKRRPLLARLGVEVEFVARVAVIACDGNTVI